MAKFIVTVSDDIMEARDITNLQVLNYIATAVTRYGRGSDPRGLDYAISKSKPKVTSLARSAIEELKDSG